MVRRVASTAVGVAAATVGGMAAIPLIQFVCLKRLRGLHPELFDGPAALRSVDAAIRSVNDDHQAAARANG